MATNESDTDAVARLRAQIETYLDQPDGDTLIADRVAALFRVVGRCVANRAVAVESEEGCMAGLATWGLGRGTEAQGKSFTNREWGWRSGAFLDPDPRLMEAWMKERGVDLDAPPNWDEIDLEALVARHTDQS